MIPLEDNAGDILAKAQRGLKLPRETDPAKLGLNPRALRELAHWQPMERGLTGLAMFTTPLRRHAGKQLRHQRRKGRRCVRYRRGLFCMMKHPIQQIFLTHAHGDHIMDLPRLKKATGAPAFHRRPGGFRRGYAVFGR